MMRAITQPATEIYSNGDSIFGVEFFGKRDTISILYDLLDSLKTHKIMARTTLMMNVGLSPKQLATYINLLEKYNLIKEEQSEFKNKRIMLSDKGDRILNMLSIFIKELKS